MRCHCRNELDVQPWSRYVSTTTTTATMTTTTLVPQPPPLLIMAIITALFNEGKNIKTQLQLKMNMILSMNVWLPTAQKKINTLKKHVSLA